MPVGKIVKQAGASGTQNRYNPVGTQQTPRSAAQQRGSVPPRRATRVSVIGRIASKELAIIPPDSASTLPALPSFPDVPSPTGARGLMSTAVAKRAMEARRLAVGAQMFIQDTTGEDGEGNRGFVYFDGERPVYCTGLLRRLHRQVFPWHGSDAPPPRIQTVNGRICQTRRGGSSKQTGIVIDQEIAHVINCERYDGLEENLYPASMSDLSAIEVVRPGRRGKGGGKEKHKRCVQCLRVLVAVNSGLSNISSWSKGYLQDCDRLGITLIASQVPVLLMAKKLATTIDDLGMLTDGTLVSIERKTGYENAPSAAPIGTPHSIIVMPGIGREDVQIPNTLHGYHQLQADIGRILWTHAYRGMPVVQSVVVYVSGHSNSPWKHTPGPTALLMQTSPLNCAWVWTPQYISRAARAVIPTL